MVDTFELGSVLQSHNQAHLLEGIDVLSEADSAKYLEQLAQVKWEELEKEAPEPRLDGLAQSRVFAQEEREERREELISKGLEFYKSGKVAVLMVAGGQGTRLGFSGPKGCYEVGLHSGKSIYQLQAEKVLAASRSYGVKIPFLIMTSPATDEETRDFFAAHDNFGLDADQVRVFSQGVVPSIDKEGKALRASDSSLLMNPDGHGGAFTALCESGALKQLVDEEVEQLVYIQVDNILVPVDDPLMLGVASSENSDVLTKVLRKRDPDEKVGHLVKVDGRDRIIEYTELDSDQVRLQDENGDFIFGWGSPAMHCWRVGFLQDLYAGGFTLPLHRSAKPLNAWNGTAHEKIDGWKCERFIFDLLPQAKVSIGLEIKREEEFAPVKNAEGNDSAESAQQLASDLYKTWLRSAGVNVDDNVAVEISPLFASDLSGFQKQWAVKDRQNSINGAFYLEEDRS